MATKKVITEDLGKIAEKALCDLLGTPYNMKFRYPQERVDALRPRFAPLQAEFAGYRHTGHSDDLNDFTSSDGLHHLSVKTTKKGWKVCPQVIGQPARSTFCPKFGLPLNYTNDQIKEFLVTNIGTVMPKYIETTFHCPVLFYCEKTNLLQLITMTSPPVWNSAGLSFSHILKNKAWNESTTLYGGDITIGEFQVHAHRDSIKFRFDLKGLLTYFPSHFTVRQIPWSA